MNYFKVLLFIITAAVGASSFAQPLSMRKDWFFGRYASLHFNEQNVPSFKDLNPYKDYRKVAVGYFKDGTFALLTDGQTIYDDKKNLLATNGNNSAVCVQVVNHSNNDSLFSIVSIAGNGLYHSVYNAYSKKMVQEPERISTNVGSIFLMAKHCYANGFWIVVPMTNNTWKSFYLSGSSIQTGPESPMPAGNTTLFLDIVSNFKGSKIAVSNYSSEGFVSLYDFDSKCGVLSNFIRLKKKPAIEQWIHPLGLDFSPNNQFLYVCYSVGKSQLVQYDMTDLDNPIMIAERDNNFDDIVMAPDGKAYLNRHVVGNPSRKFDVIDNPNLKGAACGYRENVHQLAELTSGGFLMTPFINSYSSSFCDRSVREFKDDFIGTPCVGNIMEFFTLYPENTFKEIKWIINYAGNSSVKTGKSINLDLIIPGKLKITKVKYFCDFSDTLIYEFDVFAKPEYKISRDSTICFGDKLTISVETNAKKVLWSNGDTNKSIQVQKGLYYVSMLNGQCAANDSVFVSSHPPLSILLEDQFFIFEKENELVKLDAGKGFVNYLWNPTQDTTQWIIVDKIGDYYVIVDDYRGCKGDKGTQVNERCDLIYYVPNAFSANRDGINDRFMIVGDGITKAELQIYNRWGELIFNGDGIAGWDGANAPEGVYTFLLKVEGFKLKRKVIEYQSGNVTLLK